MIAKTTTLFIGIVLLLALPHPAFAAVDLEIATVPAMEGARFEFDGVTYEANADGVVHIEIPEPGTYTIKALEFQPRDPRVRAAFQRWCCVSNLKTPEVEVPIGRTGQQIQAGYELSYLVDAEFRDPKGAPLDPSSIELIQIKNDRGLRIELGSWTPQWLLGLGTTRVNSGLITTEVLWRLNDVRVAGSNVVNAGQQALVPSQESMWKIELLFYDLNVTVTDYLFGNAAGSQVLLTFPDGEQRTYDLDQGRVSIPSLPRGSYEIGAKGSGITLVQPLALSQDQHAELDFISYADMATGVVLGLLAVTLLIIIGRPYVGAFAVQKAILLKRAVFRR
jgi:hypothetical protein